MGKDKKVPTPLLCDIDFHMQEADSEQFECLAEVRFGQDEFNHSGSTYVISIRRALLSMDFPGYEVVPKSRYGEPTQQNTVVVSTNYAKEKETQKTGKVETKGKVTASPVATFPAGSVEAQGIACVTGKQNVSANADQETRLFAVKAKGGNYWEITEPQADGSFLLLNRTFLDSDKLCELTVLPRQNHRGVTGLIKAKSRDIDISKVDGASTPGLLDKFTNNKDKVLKAFIAQQLSELSPFQDRYEGSVELAKVEIEHEES